jgi:hypothetical protein
LHWCPAVERWPELQQELHDSAAALVKAVHFYLQQTSFADAPQRNQALLRVLGVVKTARAAVVALDAAVGQAPAQEAFAAVHHTLKAGLDDASALEFFVPLFGHLLQAELLETIASSTKGLMDRNESSIAFALEAALQLPVSMDGVRAAGAKLQQSCDASCQVVTLLLQLAAANWQLGLQMPLPVMSAGTASHCQVAGPQAIWEMEALSAVLQLEKPALAVLKQLQTDADRLQSIELPGVQARKLLGQLRQAADALPTIAELRLVQQYTTRSEVDALKALLAAWQHQLTGSSRAITPACLQDMQHVLDAQLLQPNSPLLHALRSIPLSALQAHQDALQVMLWNCLTLEPLGAVHITMLRPKTSQAPDAIPNIDGGKQGVVIFLHTRPSGAVEQVSVLVMTASSTSYLCRKDAVSPCRRAVNSWLGAAGCKLQISILGSGSVRTYLLDGAEVPSGVQIVLQLQQLAADARPGTPAALFSASADELSQALGDASAALQRHCGGSTGPAAYSSAKAVTQVIDLLRSQAASTESQQAASNVASSIQRANALATAAFASPTKTLQQLNHAFCTAPVTAQAVTLTTLLARKEGGRSGPAEERLLESMQSNHVLETYAELMRAFQHVYGEASRALSILSEIAVKQASSGSRVVVGFEEAAACADKVHQLSQQCQRALGCFSFGRRSVQLMNHLGRAAFESMDALLDGVLVGMEASRVQRANNRENVFVACWDGVVGPVMQLARAAPVHSHQLQDLEDVEGEPSAATSQPSLSKSLRLQQWEQQVEAAQAAVSSLVEEAKAMQPPSQAIIAQLRQLAAQLESVDISKMSDQQLKYLVYEPKKLQDELEQYQRALHAHDPFLSLVLRYSSAMEGKYSAVPFSCWQLDDAAHDADVPSRAHLEQLQRLMQELYSSCGASDAASWAAEAAECLSKLRLLLAQGMKAQCWKRALQLLVLRQQDVSPSPQSQVAAAAMLMVVSDSLGMALARERCAAEQSSSMPQQLSKTFLADVVLEFVKHRRALLLAHDQPAGNMAVDTASYAAIKQLSDGILSSSARNNLLTMQGHLRHLFSTVRAIQDELRSYTLGAGCTLSPLSLSLVDLAAFFCPSSSGVAAKLLRLSAGDFGSSSSQPTFHAQVTAAVRQDLGTSAFCYGANSGRPGDGGALVLGNEAALVALCAIFAQFSEGAAAAWQDSGMGGCEGLQGETGPAAQLGLAVQLLQLASHAYQAVDFTAVLPHVQLSQHAANDTTGPALQQRLQQAHADLELCRDAHSRLTEESASRKQLGKKNQLQDLEHRLKVQTSTMAYSVAGAETMARLEAEIDELQAEIGSHAEEVCIAQERVQRAEEEVREVHQQLSNAQCRHAAAALQSLQHVAGCMLHVASNIGTTLLHSSSGQQGNPGVSAGFMGSDAVPVGLLVMQAVEQASLQVHHTCADDVKELVEQLLQHAHSLQKECALQLGQSDALAESLVWVSSIMQLAGSVVHHALESIPDAASFLEDSRSVMLLQDRQLGRLVEVVSSEMPGLIRLVHEMAPSEAVLAVVKKLMRSIGTLVPNLLVLMGPWEEAKRSFLASVTHMLHVVAASLQLSGMYNAGSVVQRAELDVCMMEARDLAESFDVQVPELPEQEVELKDLLEGLALQSECMLLSLSTLPQQACFGYVNNPVALMQQADALVASLGPSLLPASYVANKAVDVLASLVASTLRMSGAGGAAERPEGLRLADVNVLEKLICRLQDVLPCEVATASVGTFLLEATSSSSLDNLGGAAETARLQLTLKRGKEMKQHASQLDSRISFMLKDLLKAGVAAAESEFRLQLKAASSQLSRFEEGDPLELLLEPPPSGNLWAARLNTAVVTLGDIYDTGRLAALLQKCDTQHVGRMLNQDQVAMWLGQYHVVGQMLVHSILDAAELLLALYDFCPRLLKVSTLARQYNTHAQQAICLLGTQLDKLDFDDSSGGSGEERSSSNAAVAAVSQLRDLEHWMFAEIGGAMIQEAQELAGSCAMDLEALVLLQEQMKQAQEVWVSASEAFVEQLRSARRRLVEEETAKARKKVEQFHKDKAEYDRKLGEFNALAHQANDVVDAALQSCLQLAVAEQLEPSGVGLEAHAGGLATVVKHAEFIASTLGGRWVGG